MKIDMKARYTISDIRYQSKIGIRNRLFHYLLSNIYYLSLFILVTIICYLLSAPRASASALLKPSNNLGLVAYYSLDDGSGLVASDFSGKGNAGTLTNGPVWTNGKLGKALLFDGSDDYVEIAESSSTDIMGNEISFGAWVYPTGGVGYQTVLGKRAAAGLRQYNLMLDPADRSTLYITISGTTTGSVVGDYAISTPWQFNTWNHIFITYNNGVAGTIYLNGQSVYSSGWTGTITHQVAPVAIGADGNGPNFLFTGKIDDIRIYSRALGATEVAALYNNSRLAKVNASMNSRGPQNGLIGLWSFDGQDISGTTVYDRSGQGGIGTLTNAPTTVQGKFGQAIKFDGVNDYISATTNIDPDDYNSGLSVSMWFYVESATDGGLMFDYGETGGWGQIIIALSSNHLGYRFGDGTPANDHSTTTPVPVGQWNHVVSVHAGASDKLYLNNVLIDDSAGGTLTNNSTGLTFGSNNGVAEYFPGRIDEVRVYGRALTAAEIAQLHNLGNSGGAKLNSSQNSRDTSGLVGLWSFDGQDISGTTAYDRSGQGENGVITNGPTPVQGKHGQALKFDGVNDYVRIAGGVSDTHDLGAPYQDSSWLAWINAYDYPLNVATIVEEYWPFQFRLTGTGALRTAIYNGSGFDLNYSGTTVLAKNTWYHVGWVIDRDGFSTIYVNGMVYDSPTSIASSASTNWEGLAGDQAMTTIGARGDGDPPDDFFFNGSIDDVRIYNRALSAAEVLKLYNRGK